MKLYGTTTSPFVRRVRAVAAEVGEPIDRIETASEAGQAALREVSPIRKVPVAIVGERTLFDSRVIIDWLTTTRGFGGLAPARDRWREHNLLNAIDSALDSVIQLFYLRRDGVAIDGTPYAIRQLERAATIFAWLGDELVDHTTFESGFGLVELTLVCALDWMEFRDTYPIAELTKLVGVRKAWGERPSLSSTRPHT